MPKLDLNTQFKEALKLMEKTDKNLFITGKAGTGKSTLLSHFCNKTKKELVVLAPTGVAALNVKGQTIHSFFNFFIDITPEKIRKKEVTPKAKNKKLYKKLKTIIIDEVSMLREDLLDCIDVFLQLYGPKKNIPFGGIQIIFVGDLYQLPPVVTSNEKEIFSSHYKTPYFFSSHAIKNIELKIIELEKVYRQKDAIFINLLNKIRNNSVEEDDIEYLNKRFVDNIDFSSEAKNKEKSKETSKRKSINKEISSNKDGIDVCDNISKKNELHIHLTETNKKAKEINKQYLNTLDGKLYTSTAEIRGDMSKDYFPTSVELEFKIGAQIMLLNNDSKKRWVNGSIGIIEAIRKDADGEEFLRVRLPDNNNKIVSISPYRWEVFKFSLNEENHIISEPIGSFTQYPFRLSWAVTVHKSQGKTFNNVIIDINRAFVAGLMYVALSRCTSFEGIVLNNPIKKGSIRTDYRIFKFLTDYQYKKSAEELSTEDKIKLIAEAIATGKKLDITYLKASDVKSKRIVKPLLVGEESYKGVEFKGLYAFCEKRQEERMFRVDRILRIEVV